MRIVTIHLQTAIRCFLIVTKNTPETIHTKVSNMNCCNVLLRKDRFVRLCVGYQCQFMVSGKTIGPVIQCTLKAYHALALTRCGGSLWVNTVFSACGYSLSWEFTCPLTWIKASAQKRTSEVSVSWSRAPRSYQYRKHTCFTMCILQFVVVLHSNSSQQQVSR